MSNKETSFDIGELNVFDFTIKDRSGTVGKFQIREMTAKGRGEYLDLFYTHIEVDDKGKLQRIRKFDGLHINLLVRCVYQDDKPVPQSTIEQWPSSIVEKLYEQAREINLLNAKDEEQTEQAKKD